MHLSLSHSLRAAPSHDITDVWRPQFLLIIKDAVETTVKAAFALKAFRLVERFAGSAEYARATASILQAAGNAAPKELAAAVAGTLSLCGDAAVQRGTAEVFVKRLQAPEPLSDAQLLVRALACALVLTVVLRYVWQPVTVGGRWGRSQV